MGYLQAKHQVFLSRLQLASANRHVTAYFESKVYPTSKIGNGDPLKMPIIG